MIEVKENKKDKVAKYVIQNINSLYFESGGGENLEFPDFELRPRDYLSFAEQELEEYLKKERSSIHLINCVSHLKRAMDCQLDVNLYALNLYKIFQKSNLKFAKKLEFFKEIGIFNSRTLERFNTVRNKMEHYYSIPKFQDIEVYFDLVTAFVALLESMLSQLINMSEINLNDYALHNERTNNVNVNIEYSYTEPKIVVSLGISEDRELVEANANIKEDRESFSYFLKLLLLFYKKENFLTDDYFLKELKQEEI